MDPRYEKYNITTRKGCVATAILNFPPFSYSDDGITAKGKCVTVLNIIMKKLGFCYTVVTAPDGFFGTQLSNGSWTGVIGLAQRKEVEIVSCPIAATHPRQYVADFSTAVTFTDYTIIYSRPVAQSNFFGFLTPISPETWYVTLGTVVFLSILTLLLKKCSPIGKSDDNDSDWQIKRRFGLAVDWVHISLFSQPLVKEPKSFGGRLMLAFWLLVAFVLGSIYRGNLNALLIVPVVRVPFDDLAGVVNQRKYQWSFLDGALITQYMKPAYEKDPTSVLGKAWSGKGELYTHVKQLPKYVLEKKMACIDTTHIVLQLMSDDFSATGECRYALISQHYFTLLSGFAGKRNSKLVEMINPLIMRMREGGIIYKILYSDAQNATFCNVTPGKEGQIQLRPLAIADFAGTFSVLVGGWVLGIAAFLSEQLVSRVLKPPYEK